MKSSRHYRTSFLTLLLTVAAGEVAHAEDQALPAVEVSSSTIRPDLEPDSPSNPYRLPTSNRAGVETFTAEDIKRLQPKDVYDLLDKATGITVTYQGRKNPFFVKERGGGSFTYIIDGAVLPTVTQRILQRIPLAAIEEFKVVRDATALTLGSLINIGASGGGDGLNTGFIIIRTRQPQASEVSLSLAGEQAVNQPTAHKESIYAGKHLGVPAGKEGMNGYVAGFASGFDQPSTPQWFDGQNGISRMAKAGLGNERASLNLVVLEETGRFEMQRGISPTTGVLDNSKWYYDPAKTTVQSLSGTVNWSADQVTLASLFATSFNQTETDASFANTAATVSNYDESTSGFSLRHNARFGDTSLALGAQNTRSWALGSSGPTPNSRWDSSVSGYAATVEQRLFDNRLFLDAGYRSDSKHVNSTDMTSNMSNVDLPPATAISLGGRWLMTSDYALNARYFDGNQGSSGSNFSMLPTPGTKLDPQTQKRGEVALEAKFTPAFNSSVTWFDVNINNQKSQTTTGYTYNGAQYYYYTQSDNQRTGYELLLRGSLTQQTNYKASWTHLTRNISSNLDVSNTVANNLYDFSVSHGWEEYTANFSVKRVDSYLGSNTAGGGGGNSNTIAPVQVGGYTRVDANLMRAFACAKAQCTTTFYGRNLGDNQYVTQQGPTGLYPDRGRTFGLELRVDY